jgi:hypothetical protein
MYVWYGTNVYNFERLPHPPAYQPTRCGGSCTSSVRVNINGLPGDRHKSKTA